MSPQWMIRRPHEPHLASESPRVDVIEGYRLANTVQAARAALAEVGTLVRHRRADPGWENPTEEWFRNGFSVLFVEQRWFNAHADERMRADLAALNRDEVRRLGVCVIFTRESRNRIDYLAAKAWHHTVDAARAALLTLERRWAR